MGRPSYRDERENLIVCMTLPTLCGSRTVSSSENRKVPVPCFSYKIMEKHLKSHLHTHVNAQRKNSIFKLLSSFPDLISP